MSSRRKVVVLVLIAILALPLASVAGPRQEPVSVSSLFERIWSFLACAWSEEGCHIDPDGGKPEPRPTEDTDEGCRIDPNGGCRS